MKPWSGRETTSTTPPSPRVRFKARMLMCEISSLRRKESWLTLNSLLRHSQPRNHVRQILRVRMTIILRRNHGGFIESVSEIWGGSGFYRPWFFWNFDGGLFEHLTSQNYEIEAGNTVIQRITGNVARNVKINFSGDIRVKSSVGLHPDKVGLAQHNTLAPYIRKLGVRLRKKSRIINFFSASIDSR